MKTGILTVLSATVGAATGAAAVNYTKMKQHEEDFAVIKKNELILKMFNKWLMIKQEGKNIADYLKENGYNKVAIYGMSYAGERLLDDLNGTDIVVAYAVDRNADKIFVETEVVLKDEVMDMEPVDAIIVTAISFFSDIEKELSEMVDCPILSLEDILYSI